MPFLGSFFRAPVRTASFDFHADPVVSGRSEPTPLDSMPMQESAPDTAENQPHEVGSRPGFLQRITSDAIQSLARSTAYGIYDQSHEAVMKYVSDALETRQLTVPPHVESATLRSNHLQDLMDGRANKELFRSADHGIQLRVLSLKKGVFENASKRSELVENMELQALQNVLFPKDALLNRKIDNLTYTLGSHGKVYWTAHGDLVIHLKAARAQDAYAYAQGGSPYARKWRADMVELVRASMTQNPQRRITLVGNGMGANIAKTLAQLSKDAEPNAKIEAFLPFSETFTPNAPMAVPHEALLINEGAGQSQTLSTLEPVQNSAQVADAAVPQPDHELGIFEDSLLLKGILNLWPWGRSHAEPNAASESTSEPVADSGVSEAPIFAQAQADNQTSHHEMTPTVGFFQNPVEFLSQSISGHIMQGLYHQTYEQTHNFIEQAVAVRRLNIPKRHEAAQLSHDQLQEIASGVINPSVLQDVKGGIRLRGIGVLDVLSKNPSKKAEVLESFQLLGVQNLFEAHNALLLRKIDNLSYQMGSHGGVHWTNNGDLVINVKSAQLKDAHAFIRKGSPYANRWEEGVTELVEASMAQDPNRRITFVGQGMGGAIAEKLAKSSQDAEPNARIDFFV